MLKEVKNRILLLLLSLLCNSAVIAQAYVNHYCVNDDLPDIVLVHYAMATRFKMTTDQWQPYVVHTFSDGRKEWLFQGFVMLDLVVGKKDVIHQLKKANPDYAQKSDWEAMINKLFLKGCMLEALDKTIEDNIKVIGAPPFKHKIIMGIPMPIKNQKNWGMIGNKRIDFSKDKDRVLAVKWYIDEFLKEFGKRKYKNLELGGFYWIEEDTENTAGIPRPVSDYIHQLGYKHYWMPYLTAVGSAKWAENGFDYCYTQPGGYNFNVKRDISKVDQACQKAYQRGMGFVMEFEYSVIREPDTFVPRLNNCIDRFEKLGVYDTAAMAYYDGAKVIYYMSTNGSQKHPLRGAQLKKVKAVMDRMANHIVNRYKKRFPKVNDTNTNRAPASNGSNGGSGLKIDDWRNPDYWHF